MSIPNVPERAVRQHTPSNIQASTLLLSGIQTSYHLRQVSSKLKCHTLTRSETEAGLSVLVEGGTSIHTSAQTCTVRRSLICYVAFVYFYNGYNSSLFASSFDDGIHFSGETIPPQWHQDAPWIDEVVQSVSVNNKLNGKAGACNGQNCPAYFLHGAGTYQRDAPYTDVPFFNPSVASTCKDDTCIFAAWGQHAHVPTIFTSPVIFFNKYTNCGNGIIEHTEMVYK